MNRRKQSEWKFGKDEMLTLSIAECGLRNAECAVEEQFRRMMSAVGWWLIYGILAVVVFLLLRFQEWSVMRSFWERKCCGRDWLRRFPDANGREIRKFLNYFVEAFGFSKMRKLCFRPEDKVMDVYRKLYPNREPDGMELETWVETVRSGYGIDLAPVWSETLTLGEIFEKTRKARV